MASVQSVKKICSEQVTINFVDNDWHLAVSPELELEGLSYMTSESPRFHFIINHFTVQLDHDAVSAVEIQFENNDVDDSTLGQMYRVVISESGNGSTIITSQNVTDEENPPCEALWVNHKEHKISKLEALTKPGYYLVPAKQQGNLFHKSRAALAIEEDHADNDVSNESESTLGEETTKKGGYPIVLRQIHHNERTPGFTMLNTSMAEFGAHLTSTTTDEGSPPSIFEVLAQENLMVSLRPAIKYAFKIIAERNPARYGWLYGYGDELYSSLDLVLEYHYLKHYSASFAENFYGMKRVPLINEKHADKLSGLFLGRSRIYRSLLCLVLVPYIKQKCDQLYEKLRDRRPEVETQRLSMSGKLYKAFLGAYPLLHMVWEGTMFGFQLAYVFGQSGAHSPLLKFAGVHLHNLTEDDILGQAAVHQALTLSKKSVPGKVLAVLSWSVSILAVTLSSGLSVGAFFLQFLEWWYASDQDVVTLTALPTPAPPKKISNESVPILASVCPLCYRMRTNDTALAVTGFVFCYPCVYNYVQQHHCCPVTGYPAETDHLVRLFLPDR